MAFTNLAKIDPIKIDTMLTNECERDIQLELNRNYLKSFPARLKFCHIVSECVRCGARTTRHTLIYWPFKCFVVVVILSSLFLVDSFLVALHPDCFFILRTITIGSPFYPFPLHFYWQYARSCFLSHQPSTGRRMEKFVWPELIS